LGKGDPRPQEGLGITWRENKKSTMGKKKKERIEMEKGKAA